MSPSAQFISDQLEEIIDHKKNSHRGAWEVQEQVVDGGEVFNAAHTSSVLNTVHRTINNKFEHECLYEAVRQLKANHIRQSTDDCVPGH
jgi:hypothetical protein